MSEDNFSDFIDFNHDPTTVKHDPGQELTQAPSTPGQPPSQPDQPSPQPGVDFFSLDSDTPQAHQIDPNDWYFSQSNDEFSDLARHVLKTFSIQPAELQDGTQPNSAPLTSQPPDDMNPQSEGGSSDRTTPTPGSFQAQLSELQLAKPSSEVPQQSTMHDSPMDLFDFPPLQPTPLNQNQPTDTRTSIPSSDLQSFPQQPSDCFSQQPNNSFSQQEPTLATSLSLQNIPPSHTSAFSQTNPKPNFATQLHANRLSLLESQIRVLETRVHQLQNEHMNY